MKSKIKKLIQYGIPVAVIILVLIGYSESRSEYKEAGKDCNYSALEWSSELSRVEANAYYEKDYVSCMRSKGYLLESVDTLREN